MTDFQLDTTGDVLGPVGPIHQPDGRAVRVLVPYVWAGLDAFTQGYILAMFEGLSVAPQSRPDGKWDWALTDLNEADWWCDDKPADAPAFKAPRFDSLAPETLTRIVDDCVAARRLQTNRDGVAYSDSENAGRMFWRDRQNVEREPQGFLPLTVELDDDGKARFET